MTQCSSQLGFGVLAGKGITGGFDGGDISSDGGLMLVAEAVPPENSIWPENAGDTATAGLCAATAERAPSSLIFNSLDGA